MLSKDLAAQQAAAEQALLRTGTQSISDLAAKLVRARAKRGSLQRSQLEVEEAVSVQSRLTAELQTELEQTLQAQKRAERSEFRSLHTLQEELVRKAREVEELEASQVSREESNASVLLSISEMLDTLRAPNQQFRSTEDALDCLRQKVIEYTRWRSK